MIYSLSQMYGPFALLSEIAHHMIRHKGYISGFWFFDI